MAMVGVTRLERELKTGPTTQSLLRQGAERGAGMTALVVNQAQTNRERRGGGLD